MYKFIDTHAHLDQIDDIENILRCAKDSGVEAVIGVGTDYNSNIRLLDIAKLNCGPKVLVALGIHPTEIKDEEIEKTLKLIEENIKNIVAIGEIGLDYWHKEIKKDKSKKELQKEVFKKQLKLAKNYNLTAIIHSRGAWGDCLQFCLDEGIKKAIFHWYSGPLDVLNKIIENNFFISATPSLEYSPQHSQAIKEMPIEKLLLETDSPVFFGNDENGFRAEPKDVKKTLALVAKVKNITEEDIVKITNETAEKLFNIKI